MPLALGAGRTKDAVILIPVESEWQDCVATFLDGLGAKTPTVEQHVGLLKQRAEGQLPWLEVLGNGVLPGGRAMPAGKRYAQMLVHEDLLPLYQVGPLKISLDLHNPRNEAQLT